MIYRSERLKKILFALRARISKKTLEQMEQKNKILKINHLILFTWLFLFQSVPNCSVLFHVFQCSKGKIEFTEKKLNFFLWQ